MQSLTLLHKNQKNLYIRVCKYVYDVISLMLVAELSIGIIRARETESEKERAREIETSIWVMSKQIFSRISTYQIWIRLNCSRVPEVFIKICLQSEFTGNETVKIRVSEMYAFLGNVVNEVLLYFSNTMANSGSFSELKVVNAKAYWKKYIKFKTKKLKLLKKKQLENFYKCIYVCS